MRQAARRMKILSNSRYPAGYDGMSVAGGIEIEDLFQSGYFALVEAVEHFDPGRGSFLTLLGLYLKREFSRTQGVNGHNNKPCFLDHCSSIDIPCGENGDEPFDVIDTQDPIEQADGRIFVEQLSKALDSALLDLPEKQRDCIRRHYLNGESQVDIAKDYGVSKQRIKQILNVGLDRLRGKGLEEFLAGEINYYFHVSPEQFNSTHESSTEKLAFDRIRFTVDYNRGKE